MDDTAPILDLGDEHSPLRQLLDHITVLGIVDSEQLGDLPRYQRDQAIEQLTKAKWIQPLKVSEHFRAGRKGRAPLTYILTAEGATQAREAGIAPARAYEQQNFINQAHDICTLDIRLAAQRAGLTVTTERKLELGDRRLVRPDNAVTLPDGVIVLFETEGSADVPQRARIVEKALEWNASASALKQAGIAPRVRVLLNQKTGPELQQTLDIWAEALAAAQATLGKLLDVQFWGKCLPEFLENPAWDSVESFARLDDPARAPDFGLSPETEKVYSDSFETPDLLPPALRRKPVAYARDRVRLRAHGRYFSRRLLPEIPPFSSEFFDLMREVHSMAFPTPSAVYQDVAETLSIPYMALIMLRTYIRHYTDLHQALFTAHRKLQNSRSILIALRQASRLVYTFLDFHGLRHDRPGCRVWVNAPDLSSENSSDFSVKVRLSMPAPAFDTVERQWEDFQRETAAALAWVLQQLLDYPQILGIDESPKDAAPRARKKHKPHKQAALKAGRDG